MSVEAGPPEQVREDRSDRAGEGRVLTALVAAAVMLGLTARPGLVIERVAAAGEGWVESIALQRCLALHEPKPARGAAAGAGAGGCESPLAGLRAGLAAPGRRGRR